MQRRKILVAAAILATLGVLTAAMLYSRSQPAFPEQLYLGRWNVNGKACGDCKLASEIKAEWSFRRPLLVDEYCYRQHRASFNVGPNEPVNLLFGYLDRGEQGVSCTYGRDAVTKTDPGEMCRNLYGEAWKAEYQRVPGRAAWYCVVRQ